MKTPAAFFRLVSAAALAAAVALPAAAQVDLTRIGWIGDSIGAGFTSNCLTKRVQVDSAPAIIARTANVADFQQPIVNDPGLGGCMTLLTLAPSFGAEPSTGTPANLALPRPYNNLSIAGCTIHEMLFATTGAETAGPGFCRSLIDLVLRNSALHAGSQVDQAIALNPTFVVLENVANDYLGAVLSGTVIDGVTVTPVAAFAADYNAALTKLKAKQPKGIVFGVGDVTNIPFATTLPTVLLSGGKPVLIDGAPVPLLGPKGCAAGVTACTLPPGTLVTLSAAAYLVSGFGIPCKGPFASLPNCGKPLPASAIDASHPGVLLYAADVAFLKQRTADYNTAIKAAAAASGYKYYDVGDWQVRLKAGFDIGGAVVSSAFLTGGAVSYDGLHPTPIGYALLADDIIQFMNANFDAGLPRVNLSAYLLAGGTNGGLSGPFTGSFAWAPMNDAEKATAIEQIFTPEFAAQLASMFSFSKPAIVQGDPGQAPRVERHHRGIDQP